MRLIDAENLLKRYEWIKWYSVSKDGQFRRGATTEDNPFIHYYDGKEIIKNAPTVDAVEVVRCRECKHYATADFDGDILCGCTLHSAMLDITPDSFCSYGERKEGDD